jgi:hypothetical protein
MKTFLIFSLCLCALGEEATYRTTQERTSAIVQIESQGKRVLHDDFMAGVGKIIFETYSEPAKTLAEIELDALKAKVRAGGAKPEEVQRYLVLKDGL